MTDIPILPVTLCGGAGTRLWPLSRRAFPKQFVPLVDGKSLLQLTLERGNGFAGGRHLVVAAEEHRFLVAEAMAAAGARGEVLLEPEGRNTAAAMAIAALHAGEGEQLLLFCPADHHIPDAESLAATVRLGVAAARAGSIVTFGVAPSFPSTAYGYIAHGAVRPDGAHVVAKFIEKPGADAAQRLLLQGGVSWNAGIFLCSAKVLLEALRQHAPDILASCQAAMAGAARDVSPDGTPFVRPLAEPFIACRAQSIDYAVMEKHGDVALVPFHGAWSDVGSWNAIAQLEPADGEGNRVHGQGLAHRSADTFIHAPWRPVVALGVRDLVVVDTPDAVLVAHRDAAEQVRDVVALLDKRGDAAAALHRKVARPWGWYDTLDTGRGFQVKRIGVKPGASLSLQVHRQRAEHWVVVRGTAEVTRGNETFLLRENESTYIPIGQAHRLRNPGDAELEIIEVQSGAYLGEDDIERLDDQYGRHR